MHRRELLAAAGGLVDHRDYLLDRLPELHRTELAEAIDHAGAAISVHPTVGLAGAVAYAAWLLRVDGPAGPVVRPAAREAVVAATRVSAGFAEVADIGRDGHALT